jgi:sulfate transport system permease protein
MKTLVLKQPSILPGFGMSLGFVVFYLSIIVLIPLSGLIFKSMDLSVAEFWKVVTDTRLIHAYQVTFGISLLAALVNSIMGLIVAWVLVRYQFPCKRFMDSMVDLPFALPTAVAGIALAAIYSPDGWVGKYFDMLGIQIAFTPIGIFIALLFVGLPFVVRTVEPVLQDISKEVEEAAMSLGANRWQTFSRVILPSLTPALLTGFAMAFARGLGEYGSVIFIAGNIPNLSEIVPLIIVMKLEQYEIAAATSIALVMLAISFLMLFVINWLQSWSGARKVGH